MKIDSLDHYVSIFGACFVCEKKIPDQLMQKAALSFI